MMDLENVGKLLDDVRFAKYKIKALLEKLFPEGSKILVSIKSGARPSEMTVMRCDGAGFVRAYMEKRPGRRFARDFYYLICKKVED